MQQYCNATASPPTPLSRSPLIFMLRQELANELLPFNFVGSIQPIMAVNAASPVTVLSALLFIAIFAPTESSAALFPNSQQVEQPGIKAISSDQGFTLDESAQAAASLASAWGIGSSYSFAEVAGRSSLFVCNKPQLHQDSTQQSLKTAGQHPSKLCLVCCADPSVSLSDALSTLGMYPAVLVVLPGTNPPERYALSTLPEVKVLTQYGMLQSDPQHCTHYLKKLSSKALTIVHLGQHKTQQSPFSHCKRAGMKGNCPMSCQSAPSTKQLHQHLLSWANLCTHSGDSRLDSQCQLHCNTSLLSLLSDSACAQ